MPEIVLPLDRLHWLVNGKPTASELENLGGRFNPQFHFLALLPSPALPASEASKAQSYFDAMLEALVPVRDSIAAYWLRGVMSRTPISDFSLEVQFLDPKAVEKVLNALPRELSGSAVNGQRRYENTPTTQAEVSMFFRDKNRQQNPVQADGDLSKGQDAGTAPEAPSQESDLGVVATATAAPAVIVFEPVRTAPPVAPIQSLEPNRKRMVVAEGVIIQGGDILGCEHLAIAGEAYSTIDRCEKLEIMKDGIFKGSASVGEAEISGYCKGTLVVRDTLRITRTGHVVGSVQYGRLQVEDGGRIEGEMKLPLKGDEAASTDSENPRWTDLNAKLSA